MARTRTITHVLNVWLKPLSLSMAISLGCAQGTTEKAITALHARQCEMSPRPGSSCVLPEEAPSGWITLTVLAYSTHGLRWTMETQAINEERTEEKAELRRVPTDTISICLCSSFKYGAQASSTTHAPCC